MPQERSTLATTPLHDGRRWTEVVSKSAAAKAGMLVARSKEIVGGISRDFDDAPTVRVEVFYSHTRVSGVFGPPNKVSVFNKTLKYKSLFGGNKILALQGNPLPGTVYVSLSWSKGALAGATCSAEANVFKRDCSYYVDISKVFDFVPVGKDGVLDVMGRTAYSQLPECLIEDESSLVEALIDSRVNRSLVSKVAGGVQNEAVKQITRELVREAKGPGVTENRFAVLAETDVEAAFICGFCHVPVSSESHLKMYSELSGFRSKNNKPASQKPKVAKARDENYRAAVRRIKRRVVKSHPASSVYAIARYAPEVAPDPVRRLLVKRLRKAIKGSIGMKTLRDRAFVVSADVCFSFVRDRADVPVSLRTRFLRKVATAIPTAPKGARSSGDPKK